MTPGLPLSSERYKLVDATQELIQELAGLVPAGRVIACVVRYRDALERQGVRAGLARATESMARSHLQAPTPTS